MRRATYGFREHVLRPDIGRPDAEPTTFHMRCGATGCKAMSRDERQGRGRYGVGR